MADAGWITRDGPDLQLFVPGPFSDCPRYDFVKDGLDPGAPKVRRQVARSFYEIGAVQLDAREDMASAGLRFFVVAADHNEMQDNLAELAAALKQREFELWLQFDGLDVPYAWEFWKGEVVVGFTAPFLRADSAGMWAPVSVSTERHPTPLSGPAI